MSDRTGQIWNLGGRGIYLIVEPAVICNDPLDWTFGLSGTLEHRALELTDGLTITLLELDEGAWEQGGDYERLL